MISCRQLHAARLAACHRPTMDSLTTSPACFKAPWLQHTEGHCLPCARCIRVRHNANHCPSSRQEQQRGQPVEVRPRLAGWPSSTGRLTMEQTVRLTMTRRRRRRLCASPQASCRTGSHAQTSLITARDPAPAEAVAGCLHCKVRLQAASMEQVVGPLQSSNPSHPAEA